MPGAGCAPFDKLRAPDIFALLRYQNEPKRFSLSPRAQTKLAFGQLVCAGTRIRTWGAVRHRFYRPTSLTT